MAHWQDDHSKPLNFEPPVEIWADPDLGGEFVPFMLETRWFEVDRPTFENSTQRSNDPGQFSANE